MSPSRNSCLFRVMVLLTPMAIVLTACEGDPTTSSGSVELAVATGAPVVSSTNPSATVRDTTINVHVLGSGFDRGSKVDFALNGVVAPKLKVNSTQFVKSTDLLVNVTVAADASAALYDVMVTASTGKKGIGTELMAVVTMIDLGTPTGGYSYGRDVNSSGVVVGEYQVSGSTCKRAYVWTDATKFALLPQSALGCVNYAVAINDAGVVVGHVYGTGPRALLRWTPTGSGTWSLEQLPDPEGFTLGGGGAVDISENGTILAEYMAPDGSYRQHILQNGSWQLLKRTAAAASASWRSMVLE
jgi:uncharacterized membrane protein